MVLEQVAQGYYIQTILEENVANHKSAIKRHKQSLVRAERNRANRTRVKNIIKKVRSAILVNDKEAAQVALVQATSVLDKACTKGAMHWKTVARKISRLALAVNKIDKAEA